MKNNSAARMATKKLAVMAMLTGLSVVLVWLIHFPIFPAVAFLEYDPADIAILVGTFTLGPWAGLGMTVVASVIQGVTVSAQSGIYGIIMHFIATGAMVLTAGLIYKYKRTFKGAVMALILGVLVTGGVMVVANILITPHFMGAPRQLVLDLMLPGILPFNLLKMGINSAVTLVIYKPLSKLIHMFVDGRKKGAQQA